ncbi:MAG: glycosyltransferase family 4 protein [Acidobacteria bacterium]|nr:glycosyltransferase family 4 protein [Acidobacteriota bacterium]MBW4044164.1 glycosyltransferase family 4 protein [Acidobacteriota bacterium]
MKKILIIDIGSPYGGVEAYVESLTSLLQGQATLFVVCALTELAERLRSKGVKVVCIPLVAGWAKGLRFLLTLCVVPYLVLRYRIDVVQVNGYLETLILLPARILGRDTLCTRHGPFETDLYKWYRSPARYFPRLFCRYFIHFATRVICVSEAVEKTVCGIVPADRVTVVPNWVNIFPSEKVQRDKLNSPASLLYVGRLEKYKGLQLILEAMRGLPDVRLTVLGDGSYRDELMQLAQGLDVQFKGFCSETAPYYRSADIFINPSYGPEGLPIVSLECMSHGVPSIFSDLPVHEEISGGRRAAALFKVGDAQDLRQKLVALLSDSERRHSLSLAARAMVHEKYSPEAARKGYFAAFEVQDSEAGKYIKV